MVRIYCLTSIFPSKDKLQNKLQIENSGTHSSFDDNTFAIFERIKNDSEIFKSYQLTEINMGYEFIRNSTKKRFFLCIYRNDTGWIKIRMLPGIMECHSVSKEAFEFLIASSKLYPNAIEFDIKIIVRCIRNTKTRGCITEQEEKCYEEYLEKIKKYCGSPEDAFREIPFSLPNETLSKSLKQKIFDISNLVKTICNPKNENEINLPENARYVQELRCFRPQIIRGHQGKHSQYFNFISQNSRTEKEYDDSRKAISIIFDTSMNALKSYTDSLSHITMPSSNAIDLQESSRKRGRPSLYENEEERKIAKIQNSKEYNQRIKLQREFLKTEIMDIEEKQQHLSDHLQNLRSKMDLINIENAAFHKIFQKWKDLFKKSNENLKESVPDVLQNNANDNNTDTKINKEIEHEPQNSPISKPSEIMDYQKMTENPQKLLTRREKQKIAIQRYRNQRKIENHLLEEKKNLLLCSIKEITETTKAAEKLLSFSKSFMASKGNLQTNSELLNIKQIFCDTYLSTLDKDTTTPPRTTCKADNRNKTNYERKVDNNLDLPVCMETYAFSTLIELTLQNCDITELTNFNALPSTLSSLNLSNNKIRYISESISELKNLKELNLAGNQRLIEIPWDHLPSNLMRLNIQDTSITHIPSTIEKLNLLETLELGNENFEFISWKSISENLQKISIKKATKKLNKIDLNDKCNLSFISFENMNLEEENSLDLLLSNADMQKSLQYLYLTNNRLKAIPRQILTSFLKVLKIERNEIEKIDHISHLNSLYRLEMNQNRIENISDTIGKLQALTIIQLEKNFISSLPNGFENLLNLKYLNLKNNKLNYKSGNLEKSLWKRLPQNLLILKLDGNNLHKIPCFMKKLLKVECLAVNYCNLENICPYFITAGRKNMFILEIRDNPKLENLPIIPFKIYQPPTSKLGISDQLPLAELNLITDNKSFVNSKRFLKMQNKPIYKFEYCKENDNDSCCKCCAGCGDITDEKRIEQMMVMDINLCVPLNPNSSYSFLFQKSFDDETLMDYLHENYEKISTKKDRFYGPGTWKTMVKIRLCPDCLDNFKVKTETAFLEFQISNAEMKEKEVTERLSSEPELITQTVNTPMSFSDTMSPYQQPDVFIHPHLFNEFPIESDNHVYSYTGQDNVMHSNFNNDFQISMPATSDFNFCPHKNFTGSTNCFPPLFHPAHPSSSTTDNPVISGPPNDSNFISLNIIKNETSEFDPFPSTSDSQNSEQQYYLHSLYQSSVEKFTKL